MNQQLLSKINERDIAAHIQVCFGTPSGEIVWEVLRKLCFMAPSREPDPIESAEQATSRIGLTNLFRKLEYYRTQTPILKEHDDD